jgi:uncharacterized protein
MSEAADNHSLASGRAFPWHELYVPDEQAAMDFYAKALDMESQAYPMGEMGTYNMLKINGTALAGVMSTTTMGAPNIPPHWAVYLGVDDVDARVAKCTALGAQVLVPAMDVPNVGRMCLIQDPQGATLWLFKSAEM